MKNILGNVLLRQKHICPWWLCFTFDNPLRRLIHSPETILSKYVRSGDTVLDVGPGMGYFSIPLAGLVGPRAESLLPIFSRKCWTRCCGEPGGEELRIEYRSISVPRNP